jgi:hypothetical protein
MPRVIRPTPSERHAQVIVTFAQSGTAANDFAGSAVVRGTRQEPTGASSSWLGCGLG